MRHEISVVGLGYVGLPLAIELSKSGKSILGFDVDKQRIQELNNGFDRTAEIDERTLKACNEIKFTDDPRDLNQADIHIISVPTPIDNFNIPNLEALRKASKIVGTQLRKNSIVVYESTVYPGVTEDICVPILEKSSGLQFGNDFQVGYSPERINPADKERSVRDIVKVVSASDKATLEKLKTLYESIIDAGVYCTNNIKTAEAAKVIENIQRDVNIALVNELAQLFAKMNIDISDVLDAAGTKWNFVKYHPGLVGGHCIGVDPYYLSYKASSVNFSPNMILSGREINDNMAYFVANHAFKMFNTSPRVDLQKPILILGVTFKANCPDIRNSKVFDLMHGLESYGCTLEVFDPYASKEEVFKKHKRKMLDSINQSRATAAIICVDHIDFSHIEEIKNVTNVNAFYSISKLKILNEK